MENAVNLKPVRHSFNQAAHQNDIQYGNNNISLGDNAWKRKGRDGRAAADML